jgi:energy-coupling factor transporter ATP-binding protein EcfA2
LATTSDHTQAGTRRLGAIELAESAVLVDITLVLSLLGWLLPYGAGLFVAATIPVVVLGARHRFRVVVVALFAGAAAGFVLGGNALALNVAELTLLGGFLGLAARRGWGPARTVAVVTGTLWPPLAAGTVGLLALFADLRRLTLDQVRNSWDGLARLVRNLGFVTIADAGDAIVRWGVRHWYILLPAVELVGLAFTTLAARSWSLKVLARVERRRARMPLGSLHDVRPPGPLPVGLDGVDFRYPGALWPALHDVTIDVQPGAFYAVTGPNGAGKSSLTRVLAGAPVERGRVVRPGGAALGGLHGTAVIFQRPESQVLGVRVRDDVVWGLPAAHAREVDVDALLDAVGLDGLADRETSTLSGGQLQRLALAAALARRPALLLSDESTAMVDAPGRLRLLERLRALVSSGTTTVVHVTHRVGEIEPADTVLRVEGGAIRNASVVPPAPEPVVPAPRCEPGHAVVDVRGAGFVYAPRSPWEHRALTDVTTTVRAGETLLVVGANGSGKTTLAWLLAGLLAPTEGEVLFDGVPVDTRVGAVGLGFQHARLQLLRPTVREELAIATGDDVSATRALLRVGLDPALTGNAVDALSGGQQRRVLLARLLAAGSRVLVLDEPFAGLDDDARAALASSLAVLRSEREVALVIVSHDLDDVAPFADRILGLRAGELVIDGSVAALGDAASLIAEDVT